MKQNINHRVHRGHEEELIPRFDKIAAAKAASR
jgi:hypothetical protein